MTRLPLDRYFQIAVRHHQSGRLAEAEQLYLHVLGREPGHADALHLLGVIVAQTGRTDAAVDLIGRAVALKPRDAEALYNHGKALNAAGRHEEAAAAYRRAVALEPGRSDAWNNLGVALQAGARLEEAVEVFRRATGLQPTTPEACNNLGSALRAVGQPDEAMAAYRRALALRADYADAHANLALALLAAGDFPSGWEEYEWRWKCREFAAGRRDFRRPLWDGGSLAGRRILLHAEQGFGDTFQMIRYLPLVAEKGGEVIVECQPELRRLIQSTAAGFTAVARGEPLPAFDVHCPLMSLPRAFKTTLDTIPSRTPYLHPDVGAAREWLGRIAGEARALKVGLAWAGSNTNSRDRDRSIPLSAFAPLSRIQGVKLYSLQKGGGRSRPEQARGELELTDWTDELRDFADTAALISNLDLVISVDTAVAHLAGAMGKTAWVLLPYSPHWCWLLGRTDSPWYPTLRLFRQEKRGDWGSALDRAARALADFR